MLCLSGHAQPWANRVDHLICEVPDIEVAVTTFLNLGFPIAWPVGRFWSTGRTAGVAMGGFNLEFVQPDERPPQRARIQTIVFEPTQLDVAAKRLGQDGIPTRLSEKWESDPTLLKLRGYTEAEAQVAQLICRNLYPTGTVPFDFFLCEYSPVLRQRLAPSSFPEVVRVAQIIIGTPDPWRDWREIDASFGLPLSPPWPEIQIQEEPTPTARVTAIRSDRGPIDLGDWPAEFEFI